MQFFRNNRLVLFIVLFLILILGYRFLILRNEKHWVRVRVTIPEGYDISDIAGIFAIKLPRFSTDKFLLEAKNKDGYLFPDTYVFSNTDNEEDVIRVMSDNFGKKITPLLSEIFSGGKRLKEIIILASIIEKEAKGDNDRGFISDVLWKRINTGMPLQVDSVPETYKSKGLPKNPICNPGLEAIKAAIYPEHSPYLYYLHDKDGNVHYAKTFTEHKANKLKYLK